MATFLLPEVCWTAPYPLRINQYLKVVEPVSVEWLLSFSHASKSERERRTFKTHLDRMKLAELAAWCYPLADRFRLQVCMDFTYFVFTLDDWVDDFTEKDALTWRDHCIMTMQDLGGFQSDKTVAKMTRSFFSRMVPTLPEPTRSRFILHVDLFCKGMATQAAHRRTGYIPSLEEFIPLRLETACVRPVFVLIEWAGGFSLPDFVINHPVIRDLEDLANNYISFMNDIFSYNKEQAINDTHNLITIVQHHKGLTLQQSLDWVGKICRDSVKKFEAIKGNLPSWVGVEGLDEREGREMEKNVRKYVKGLEDWMVASLEWSYTTERYFGKDRKLVHDSHVVRILPPKAKPPSSPRREKDTACNDFILTSVSTKVEVLLVVLAIVLVVVGLAGFKAFRVV